MVTGLFLRLLNMSIAASWLVLAVIVVRSLFQKMPKWVNCLLWGVVALRLLLPFSFESPVSLLPSGEVIPQDILVSQTPAIHSGIPAVNDAVNPVLTQQLLQGENLPEKILSAASTAWLLGVVAMLIYSSVSYLALRFRIRTYLSVQKNVRICDAVDSPFVLGIFAPKIYLPSGMDPAQAEFVLAHEQAHIQRRDHWWKPLGYLLLTVYWFNPLLWVGYILLCRDIERACDEKVITNMDNAGKKGYSQALLACGVHRRMIMACPVAFGEVGVKSRIKGVLRYKKPSFWILLLSVVACVVTAVCFLTDPIPCRHHYHSQIAVASTCTEHGIEINRCDRCQHSYARPAKLLSHSYDNGVVTQAPTCTHTGVRTLHCTACNAQMTQSVAQLAHTLGASYTTVEPDCTHTGQRSATCAGCGAEFVTEILQTNDKHDMQEIFLQPATCTAPGKGVRKCTRCDYSESCSYPKLEHHLQTQKVRDANCILPEVYKTFCSNCNYFTFQNGSTAEHQWKNSVNGRKECAICGFITKESNTSPLYSVASQSGTPSMPSFPTIQITPKSSSAPTVDISPMTSPFQMSQNTR